MQSNETPLQIPVRWGVLSAANIAVKRVGPAIAASSNGRLVAVGSRNPQRAQELFAFAPEVIIYSDYESVINDPEIEAIYIPLPNSLHAEWTIRALQAGKPVLCEKPLCGTLAETERVLAVARETRTALWEAFVFPFHDQFARVQGLLADGAIGELRENQSDFHFSVGRPDNIRLSASLAGGALNDVGCYPVRLALELFGRGHETAWATSEWGGQDVDMETWGSLGFAAGRRLLLSCGMRRSIDPLSTLVGN